jgi:membrane-associated phospholipid phosphatase
MIRIKTSRSRTLLIVISVLVFACYQKTASASGGIEKTGDVLQFLIPAAAFGTTFYFDDSDGRTQFYKSFATNIAITYGLKEVIHKERPNGSNKSFPSGHTSVAFQGASYLHRRYGINYAIAAVSCISFCSL